MEKHEINKRVGTYYKDLYAEKPTNDADLPNGMRNLVNDTDGTLAAQITIGEVSRTLFMKLNQGNSPGNDGLTVGLYKVLW